MGASGVRLGSSGLVVVRSSPPVERSRILIAAEAMRAARGIAVDVVDIADGDVVEVTVAYAGRSPEPQMTGAATAALGARLAAALADLHALGLAHDAIERDHVLVDADGCVRLCGFGSCAPGDGAADVRALGDLLDALLDPRDRSDDAAAVRAAIERTRADATPTAAAIAASLAARGRPAVMARPATPATAAARRRAPRSRTIAASVAIALIAVTIAAAATTLAPRRSAPERGAARPVTSTSTTATTAAARRVWPAAPVTFTIDGTTWRFGAGDDRALVGAWGCSAEATPALVREDGTVWLVEALLDGATGVYVTTVEGDVVDARVERVDGCDDLVVTTSSGTVRPLA